MPKPTLDQIPSRRPVDGVSSEDGLTKEQYARSPEGVYHMAEDLLGRFGHDDSAEVTTPVVNVAGDDDEWQVSVGREVNDYNIITIFRHSKNDSTKAPWVQIRRGGDYSEVSLTDGDDNPLDDSATVVACLLQEIAADLSERTKRHATEFDVVAYATEELGEIRQQLLNELARLSDMLLRLEAASGVTGYKIVITSGWRQYGEHDLERMYEDTTLAEAIRMACEDFKSLNSRSDVQGGLHAFGIIPGGSGNDMVEIPLSVTNDVFQQYATHSNLDSQYRRKLNSVS